MPSGNSTRIAPGNTQRQFRQYLRESGGPKDQAAETGQAPEDAELIFSRNWVFNRGTFLDFGSRRWSWFRRQISRLRARDEVAKLIDAQFGGKDIVVTRRPFFADETLGNRLMKDCATDAGFSFNKIDDAALAKIANRIVAIRGALGAAFTGNDTSKLFKPDADWQCKPRHRITHTDLKKIYSKAEGHSQRQASERAFHLVRSLRRGDENVQAELTVIAHDGPADLQFALSKAFGIGVGYKDNPDFSEAAAWLVRAAQGGLKAACDYLSWAKHNADPAVQCALGQIYRTGGDGIEPDTAVAADWIVRSAQKGSEVARTELERLKANNGEPALQFAIGEAYYHGAYGIARDHKEAAFFYDRAAQGGDAGAQYRLGVLNNMYHDVPQDIQQALYWLVRADQQGHRFAQREMTRLRSSGQDRQKTVPFELYKLYSQGADGIGRDPDKASENLVHAALNKHADARDRLERLVRAKDPHLNFALYKIYTERNGRFGVDLLAQLLLQAAVQGHDKALAALEHLKQNGEPALCFTIGEFYRLGLDPVDADMAEAASWHCPDQPAICDALCCIGRRVERGPLGFRAFGGWGFYSNRTTSEDDRWVAIDYYLRAIEQSGKTGDEPVPPGLGPLTHVAINGPANLKYMVAQTYEEWREKAPDNMALAVEWYEGAAVKGHVDACYRLHRIYGQGDGVVQNHQLAARWLERARAREHRGG